MICLRPCGNSILKPNLRLLAAATDQLACQKRTSHYNNWYKIEREQNRRYNQRQKDFFKNNSYKDMAIFTSKELKKQASLLIEELKELNQRERKHFLAHGDLEYLFKFDESDKIDKWQVNTDAGYEIGNSEATFVLTEQKTGLFKGFLRNDFDKPEKMKAIYTGYANITSIPQNKALFRSKFIDLTDYTHFRLKIRGDGRNYMFILKNHSKFQETRTYLIMHPIYSHGGPYWQELRIPFSKFFQVTHGRISDRQFRFVDNDIVSLGITCMDGIEGPFSLEIDSIAAYKDNQMKEMLAYETYKIPKYISNT